MVVPTYNERENLPPLSQRLLSLPVPVDMLVVDDNSPDGTGKVADELAAQHPAVHVLHRQIDRVPDDPADHRPLATERELYADLDRLGRPDGGAGGDDEDDERPYHERPATDHAPRPPLRGAVPPR